MPLYICRCWSSGRSRFAAVGLLHTQGDCFLPLSTCRWRSSDRSRLAAVGLPRAQCLCSRTCFLAFCIERPQDHLSEDVVVCAAPGVTGDSPINANAADSMEVLEGFEQQTHWAQYPGYQGVAEGHVAPDLHPAALGTPPHNTTLVLLTRRPPRHKLRSQEDALLERRHVYGGHILQ